MKFEVPTVVNTEIASSGMQCHGVWKYQWIKGCILQTTHHHIPITPQKTTVLIHTIKGIFKVKINYTKVKPAI